jgi:hypothetical protein
VLCQESQELFVRCCVRKVRSHLFGKFNPNIDVFNFYYFRGRYICTHSSVVDTGLFFTQLMNKFFVQRKSFLVYFVGGFHINNNTKMWKSGVICLVFCQESQESFVRCCVYVFAIIFGNFSEGAVFFACLFITTVNKQCF